MAFLDELRIWFERDLRAASWDENVRIDDADPDRVELRFYTDTNEYTLTITAEGDEVPFVDATVSPRKARAGQDRRRTRRLLAPGRNRLNERAWRRLLGGIVGHELVRVHRRGATEAADEAEENPISPAAVAPKPRRANAVGAGPGRRLALRR